MAVGAPRALRHGKARTDEPVVFQAASLSCQLGPFGLCRRLGARADRATGLSMAPRAAKQTGGDDRSQRQPDPHCSSTARPRKTASRVQLDPISGCHSALRALAMNMEATLAGQTQPILAFGLCRGHWDDRQHKPVRSDPGERMAIKHRPKLIIEVTATPGPGRKPETREANKPAGPGLTAGGGDHIGCSIKRTSVIRAGGGSSQGIS